MTASSIMMIWRLLFLWAVLPIAVFSLHVVSDDENAQHEAPDLLGPKPATPVAAASLRHRAFGTLPVHGAAALVSISGATETGTASTPFFTVSSARHLFAVVVIFLGLVIVSLWLSGPSTTASHLPKEPVKALLEHAEVQSIQDNIWPATLCVSSQLGHAGTYRLVSGRRANDLPVWKCETSQDWLFCGQSGQWLIGDESEEHQNFKCDTGNIASYEVHAGRMPDEIGPGGWLYFDGADWLESSDINVTSEHFTLKDQQVTISKQNTASVKIQAFYRGISARKLASARRSERKDSCETP